MEKLGKRWKMMCFIIFLWVQNFQDLEISDGGRESDKEEVEGN